MADMAVGEWHFLQNCHSFAYTNDLGGKHRRQAGMVSPWQAWRGPWSSSETVEGQSGGSRGPTNRSS